MKLPVYIESLTKRFGTLTAVDDVSLAIEPGELFFLLGPSGCGKTTLLRTIAGFYQPDAGSIKIGDREVSSLPPHQRDTGMVFQSYALWPHMTVRENVAFGLQMRKIKSQEVQARVAEALEMVKMTDRADYKPNQLSGGQQQRVALARALVIHPQCLLLDEPLSNLDAKLRLEMRGEIRRICKEAGLTAIYVTHDQKEALSIADRMAVLDAGRICQVGTPMEVYRAPQSVFTAQFIGETNLLEGRVTGVADSYVEIETPVGRLLSSAPRAGLVEGAPVTVSIRPETVRLGLNQGADENVLQGELTNTVYLGETAQHQIQLEEVSAFKVFELNPSESLHEVGKRVQLAVAREDVVVIPSDAEL